MRDRVLFAIACLLAIGVGLWLGVFKSDSNDGSNDYSVVDDDDGEIEKGPELLGAGDGRAVHVPRDIRGRGSLQGTVRRKGDPVAAHVELRHVAEMDPTKPYMGGMTQMMIERMLDAGISSKAAIAKTSAGADGQFHFDGLAPGLYEVRATAENGAVGFASALLPAEGARVEASIDVAAGSERFEGRVVYANGTPFQGLVVASTGEGFAMMMGGHGNIMPTATDDEGRFAIGGLAPGLVRISAILPGVLRVMANPVTLPYQGEYVLTIGAEGVEVNGKVIAADTQEPIAGATVFGGGGNPETTFTIRTTTSAEDGTFKLAIPTGGGGGMFVKAAGYAPSMINFRRSAKDNVTVSLQKLGTVTGIVKSKDDGKPLAGVGVYAIPASMRGGDGMFPSGTISGADGLYTLNDVMPGSAKLFAVGEGWVTEGVKSLGDNFSPFTVAIEPGGSAELDLELVPGGSASGVVRTSTGDLVAGAVVTPAAGMDGMMMIAAMTGGMGGAFGATVSDAEGRYTVASLFPGQNYTLTAKAPGLPDAKSKGFTAQGGKTHEADLVFAAPRWLLLRVVKAEDGTPVAGARARIVPAGDRIDFDDFFGAATWSTDGEGRAKVGPIPPDDSKVAVTADGFIEAEQAIEAKGDGDVELTIELAKGLVIAGRVEVPAGLPLRGIRMRVQTDHSSGGPRRDWFHERTSVDPAGTFRVTTIKDPGAYRVTAESQWEGKEYEAEAIVEAGDEDVVLKLARNIEREKRLMTVTVLGADGKPMPSARIQLYQLRSNRGTSRSRRYVSEGKAEFEIDHEDAQLWIEVYETAGVASGSTIKGPFDPGTKEIEIRLDAPLTIEGAVTGPDGKPVRGVRVMVKALHPDPDTEHGRDHGAGFSDKEGKFLVKGLGDLEYQLVFDVPPDYAPVAAQKVRAGANNVRVALRMGKRAILTIVDYDGKPVAGAFATLSQLRKPQGAVPGSSRGSQRSDADGIVRMRGVEPEGSFRLHINPPQDRSDLKRTTINPWSPTDETIKLQRAYTITGVVRDASGKPVGDVFVQHRKEGTERWTGYLSADNEGRFEIQQLVEGRYEVRAVLRGARTDGIKGTAVRAGATGVELTVDLGETLAVRIAGWKQISLGGSRTHQALQAALISETGNPTRMSGRADSRGRVAFRQLTPDATYTIWIGGLPDGHYVLKSGLRAGDADVEVEPQKGASIQGRVTFPAEMKRRSVMAHAHNKQGMSASGVVNATTGAFEIDGLPEGEWTVRVHGWDDGNTYTATGKARTGGEVELELKAPKR